MAKFPWEGHGQPTPLPTELPTFLYLEVVGCPLSCQMLSYKEVVGSLICMAQLPWAAHWQPTPLPTALPTFSYFGSSGLPTELPTELPTVSIYGSSGQPNLHGKISMGSPGQPTLLLTCSPWAAKWAAPQFFSMGSHCFHKCKKSITCRHIPFVGNKEL